MRDGRRMPDDRLIGRQLGGFEVVALIGSGAFASVYRAVQLGLDRDVALKVLDPAVARNPDAARRFIGEGQKAATLDHPAIVPVFAFMLRALAKNAPDRFSSGEELPAGLREALAGRILAPVSGGSTVPIAPPRRHPAWRRRVGGLTAMAAAVGASYLLTHRHPTSAAGALSTLKPSLVGPKRISDPNGVT